MKSFFLVVTTVLVGGCGFLSPDSSAVKDATGDAHAQLARLAGKYEVVSYNDDAGTCGALDRKIEVEGGTFTIESNPDFMDPRAWLMIKPTTEGARSNFSFDKFDAGIWSGVAGEAKTAIYYGYTFATAKWDGDLLRLTSNEYGVSINAPAEDCDFDGGACLKKYFGKGNCKFQEELVARRVN